MKIVLIPSFFLMLLVFSCSEKAGSESRVDADSTVQPDSSASVIPEKKSGTIIPLDSSGTISNETIEGVFITRFISEHTSRGTFKEIEVGDYGHFSIMDEDGNFESYFIVYKDLPISEGFSDGRNAGKKVEVTWHKVEAVITTSGDAKQEINVLKGVQLIR